MSLRATVRRRGVPAAAVGSIAIPLLLAGCPFDDLPEDAPWWYGIPGCEECAGCYDEWLGREPGDDAAVPEALGAPGSLLGEPPPDPDPLPDADALLGERPGESTAGAPEDEAEPPDTGPRPRLPDAVLRPRVDPHQRLPKSPRPRY